MWTKIKLIFQFWNVFPSQLNCLLLWYNFSCKHQKLSSLHSGFLETIHLHLFDIQVLILQTKRFCRLGSLRYGTFFELTTYRFRTVYLLFLFSCTQNVLRHLDIICQTFGKLNSSRDSGVSILYHYSVACCFSFIRKTAFGQIWL